VHNPGMESQAVVHGTPVKQFSVMIANRVGSLAALVKLLRSTAIEVLGLSMQDSRDATVVRLITSDPEGTEHLFMERGIPHTTCTPLVVAFRESGPDLLECLEQLMICETNIDFAYSLLPGPRGHSMLALHVDDYEFALSVLNRGGFKLAYQEDLSR
jgi:hypothetical protein